jgi:hypothetical protein
MQPLGCKIIPDNVPSHAVERPWAIEAKKYVGESVSQLTVSMGDQERVSERHRDKAFLKKWVLVRTLDAGRCGSAISK